MRHATDVALDALEGLLADLRRVDGLTERKRGLFYRGSSAFLHFHEDPAGFFADVKLTASWVRLDATTTPQRRKLVREVRACLRGSTQARRSQARAPAVQRTAVPKRAARR